MPEQISQHLSWDALKLGIGSGAGLLLLAGGWFTKYTFSTRRMLHELSEANAAQHSEIKDQMNANHIEQLKAISKR